jgi:hypothetical protein
MGSSNLITLEDPLTQFAVVLTALIHDVDHPGISNYQLAAEGHPLASMYYESTTVERNSLDEAWKLLNHRIATLSCATPLQRDLVENI